MHRTVHQKTAHHKTVLQKTAHHRITHHRTVLQKTVQLTAQTADSLAASPIALKKVMGF